MSDPVTSPLLHAEEARIAVDDVVAMEHLTLRSRGDRVLCAGESELLFAALSAVPLRAREAVQGPSRDVAREDEGLLGEAQVVAGSLLVRGADVARGVHLRTSGVVPLDPPLPLEMTAHGYVTWSARLAGVRERVASELASSALERVGLSSFARKVMGSFELPLRRAVLFAHAIVTDPPVLIVEAPLAGFEGAAAGFVLNALYRASEGRGVILSAERMDPGTPEGDALARAASDIFVFAGGALVLDGTPEGLFSGVRVYAVTVRRNGGPFRDELVARGLRVQGGPLRMSVVLPEHATTKEIVSAASKARAPLVEMLPIIGG